MQRQEDHEFKSSLNNIEFIVGEMQVFIVILKTTSACTAAGSMQLNL
jgi:hypothetical protein